MAAWTTSRIRARKGKAKLVTLTAHDFFSAKLLDECGAEIILVGDSLGMTVLGYDTTIPVTLDEMLHHCKAVRRAVKNAMVVGDMPFLSFQVSMSEAVVNAGRLIKEAGVDAVKIEGGVERTETVQGLVANGIPVMGHIGLMPQRVKAMGGYKVQGRSEKERARLLDDARALDAAGAFSMVLEGIPASLAAEITEAVSIPTIGIGAGPHCDGQILVQHDVLGMSGDFRPKFAKAYAELGDAMKQAFAAYRDEVRAGTFPDEDHSYE